MTLREWVEDALAQCELDSTCEGYLLGRGAFMDVIERWGITTWKCPPEPSPSPDFRKAYGPHGEMFEGRVLIPLWCPRGTLLGWDARAPEEAKKVSRFLIGDRPWSVCWIGIKTAMPKIWAGGDPWIVEGFADVFALMHALDNPILGTGPARLVYSHLEFLRRFCRNATVTLAFDPDSTGKKGTAEGLKRLRQRGIDCRAYPYSMTHDPGKIWDMGGAEGVRRAFNPHSA